MILDDFDFFLPEELIALRPVKPRTSSRLLVAEGGSLIDAKFTQLENFLRPGDRLVLNNTRVLKSFISAIRIRHENNLSSEVKVKFNLLEKVSKTKWKVLVKPLRKLKKNDILQLSNGGSLIVSSVFSDHAIIDFQLNEGECLEGFLKNVGQMPIPPYILKKRKVDENDDIDYQTVFACSEGSVAAPTASLHFDNSLISKLETMGVKLSYVTLHVGGGTFLPIKTENISEHKMHSEYGVVSSETAEEINQTKRNGKRVIAVGTTSARLLETASIDNSCSAFKGKTDIFIKPGYDFKLIDGLITNFHLPKSTLIILVASLIGLKECKDLYSHAIEKKYRFFSYGDSSLILRKS